MILNHAIFHIIFLALTRELVTVYCREATKINL